MENIFLPGSSALYGTMMVIYYNFNEISTKTINFLFNNSFPIISLFFFQNGDFQFIQFLHFEPNKQLQIGDRKQPEILADRDG